MSRTIPPPNPLTMPMIAIRTRISLQLKRISIGSVLIGKSPFAVNPNIWMIIAAHFGRQFDGAPMRRQRARVHAVGKVINGAPRDGVLLLDRPFDRRNATVTRQKRGMIADAAKFGVGERFGRDASVAMGCHDEVRTGLYVLSGDLMRILMDHDGNALFARGNRKAVVGGKGHDAIDRNAGFANEGVEDLLAKIAGAGNRNFHGGLSYVS